LSGSATASAPTFALDGIQAVSFDLDDTFWDCAPAIEHAEAVLETWLEEHAPDVLERHRAGAGMQHRARLLERTPALLGDVSELRKRSLAELFREAGHAHALSERAYEAFYRARSEVVLYDGVVELLEALSPRYRVAAITNGNADLERIGIARHFELICVATLDSPAKPDPYMFSRTLTRFGLEPQEMLHVGDNPGTDVGGAREAGCRACWFDPGGRAWPGPGPEPDVRVATIAELHGLLLGRTAV